VVCIVCVVVAVELVCPVVLVVSQPQSNKAKANRVMIVFMTRTFRTRLDPRRAVALAKGCSVTA
jgi:hypothetical protein